MKILFVTLFWALLVSCSGDQKVKSLLIEKPFDKQLAYGSLEVKRVGERWTLSTHVNNLKSSYSYAIYLIDNGSCSHVKFKDLNILFAMKDSSPSISGALFAYTELPKESFAQLDQLYGKRVVVLNKLASTQADSSDQSIEVCFEIQP